MQDRPQDNTNQRQWQNRRRMAWVALISMLIVTFCMLFYVKESRLSSLDSVVTWFYTAMAAIVGSYVGFATFDQKWRDRAEIDKKEIAARDKNATK